MRPSAHFPSEDLHIFTCQPSLITEFQKTNWPWFFDIGHCNFRALFIPKDPMTYKIKSRQWGQLPNCGSMQFKYFAEWFLKGRSGLPFSGWREADVA